MKLPPLQTLLLLATLAGAACSSAVDSTDAAALTTYSGPETAALPLPGAARRWTYTEFPNAFCRDGSRTGVAVNLSPGSDKLMIYLEQGGACFDEPSCLTNPSNAFLDLFALGWALGAAGLFDRSNPDNPVRDWNFVYVPYCTGDLHSGAKPDGHVPDVGPQKFVGQLNMIEFLPRIAATFAQPSAVLLTGASAGGTGSLTHALRVQETFPDVKLRVLDDSGPIMSQTLFSSCVQDRVRTLWGLDQTWLAECGKDCRSSGDYFQDFAEHVISRLPDQPIGLLHSAADGEIRAFTARSNAECSGTPEFLAPDVSAAALTADLLALRQEMTRFANFNTFYPDSEVHTWTANPDFYTLRVGNVRMVDWVKKLVAGENPGHLGP